MPVHDWTRVDAGIFHDFHNAWITELRNVLNVPLEATYQAAYRGVPAFGRNVLETRSS
jgi:hypothetical protein